MVLGNIFNELQFWSVDQKIFVTLILEQYEGE